MVILFLTGLCEISLVNAATEYEPDANTLLLDHLNGATSGSPYNIYYETGQSGMGQCVVFDNDLYTGPYSVEDPAPHIIYDTINQLVGIPDGTLEAWIKTSTYGGDFIRVWPKYGWPTGLIFRLGINSTGYLVYNIWGLGVGNLISDIPIPLNEWTHIAVSWGSAGLKAYINGELVVSHPSTGHPKTYSNHFLILYRDRNSGSMSIDEVRVSNVQLTSFTTLNQPPTADAGPDQTVEQTTLAGAEVVLDGSGSSDPDGDSLTYSWTWTGGSETGVNPTITFPLGTTTVTLEVSDGEETDIDTVDITVQDNTPPDVTVSLNKDTLWPPNHRYKTITATVDVFDIGDPSPTVTLISITSNEPDNCKGTGDGNTANDIVIFENDDYQFKLRAERAETGTGRIYTITYEVTDDSGNTTQATAIVTVPVGRTES